MIRRSSLAAAFALLVVVACVQAPRAWADEPAWPDPLVGDDIVAPDDSLAAEPGESPFAPPAATFEQQVVELVNVERANCTTAGCPLPPYKLVGVLQRVADAHSESMAWNDFFSHYDPSDGCSSPSTRAAAAGYIGSVGENAAAGNATPAATVAQWMASSGHRANILGGYRETGVGHDAQANDQGNVDLILNPDCDCVDAGETCNGGPWFSYWTQLFGTRSNVFPLVIERERHSIASGTVGLHVYGPTGVDDMRFSNDGVSWSAWQAYSTAKSWSLAAGDGLRTVFAEVRNGTLVYRSCDQIWRTGAGGQELFVDGFDCDGWAAWSDISP